MRFLDSEHEIHYFFVSVKLLFVSKPVSAPIDPYNAAMHPGGRPTKKARSTFGQRLAEARERAGVSQKQLAEQLGTSQQRVAYWERHATGFRSEAMLAKITEILGISADELLGAKPKRTRGVQPVGRARQLFDAVSKLPRRQQEKIFDIIQPFIAQHGSDRKAG